MFLIYLCLGFAVLLVVYAGYFLVARKPVLRDSSASERLNNIILVFFVALGSLVIVAIVPGLLWGEWTWLTDNVFGIISKVI